MTLESFVLFYIEGTSVQNVAQNNCIILFHGVLYVRFNYTRGKCQWAL